MPLALEHPFGAGFVSPVAPYWLTGLVPQANMWPVLTSCHAVKHTYQSIEETVGGSTVKTEVETDFDGLTTNRRTQYYAAGDPEPTDYLECRGFNPVAPMMGYGVTGTRFFAYLFGTGTSIETITVDADPPIVNASSFDYDSVSGERDEQFQQFDAPLGTAPTDIPWKFGFFSPGIGHEADPPSLLGWIDYDTGAIISLSYTDGPNVEPIPGGTRTSYYEGTLVITLS